MPIFTIVLLFHSPSIMAEIEYHGDTKQISKKYYDGPYLIYNCTKGHWTCVDLDGYKACQKERDQAKTDYKRNLTCAAFKEFPSKKECEVYQQSKVNNPDGKKFCLHSMIKKGVTR